MGAPAIIAGAAMLAGTYMQQRQQRQMINDQERENEVAMRRQLMAQENERKRQDLFSEESRKLFEGELEENTVEEQTADIEAAAEARQENIAPEIVADAGNQLLTGQDNASRTVKESITKQIADSAAEARGKVNALGNISAFGDVALGNAIRGSRLDSQLNRINDARRGSLNVLQLEQSIPAMQVRPSNSFLGPLLTGAGQIGLGLAGQGAFNTTPATTTSGATGPGTESFFRAKSSGNVVLDPRTGLPIG